MKKKLSLGSVWNHALDKIVLRRACVVTSPSHAYAQDVASDLGWLPERIRVVPNPLNSLLLKDALAQSTIPKAPGSAQYILYVGRIAEVKGIFPFLDALKEVRKVFPQVGVVLAGPWQIRQKPEALGIIKGDAPVEGVTAWLGFTPLEKLANLYRCARVSVVPSYFESFGLAAVEAMAYGIPVVASRTGGLAEIIQDGKTGFLVSPGDATNLAHTIIRVLSDRDVSLRIGRTGQQDVLARFSADTIAAQMINVYKNALATS
jgi:1,4-alpha-glucan branching enzyme